MRKEELKKQLEGIQNAYESDYDVVESVTRRGLDSLKSKIKDVQFEATAKSFATEQKHTPRFSGTELAEKSINTYKTKIKDATPDVGRVDDRPVTYADRERLKSVARSLTGGRNGGNAGKLTQSTPNGNGDLGTYSPPAENGDGNSGGSGSYYSLTTSMTLEQYEDYINGKFERPEIITEEVVTTPYDAEEVDVLEELCESLLQLEDSAWQSIDVVMRETANEFGYTPKELHKAFKSEFGQIPDDWLKENRDVEICGYMPLEEAIIHQTGSVYEVSMMWRGGTKRHKFFWPMASAPSKDEIQKAAEAFYPGCRVLAHYLSTDDRANYMVMCPPVTENYHFVPEDNWVEMSDEIQEVYDYICEEEGEPITVPVILEDGNVEVTIEDHDTGEEKTIVFGEGKKGLWDNIHAKRKRGEKPAKPGDKDYPKTLNVESLEKARKNVGADSCWDGYKAKGTKKKNGKLVPNCVKEDDMKGMTVKSGHKRSADSGAGLTQKGVEAYRRKNPGSKLKTAVTTPPSKLKSGSEAAGRRKSFCARSRGWNGERGKAARRRWNC